MKGKKTGSFVAALISIVAYSSVNIWIAFRLGDVLNLVQQRDIQGFTWTVLQTMLVILLLALCFYWKEFWKRRQIAQSIQGVSQQVFASVVYSTEEVHSGEMISFLTNDLVSSLTAKWEWNFVLAENILLLLFAVGSLWILHPSVSLAVILAAVALVFFPRLFRNVLSRSKSEQTKRVSNWNQSVSDAVGGFDTIKGFAAEQVFQEEWKEHSEQLERANVRYQFLSSLINHAQFGFSLIIQMGILLFAAVLIARGYLEIGSILLVGQLLSFVSEPIEQILSSRNEVFANRLIAERIEKMTATLPQDGAVDKAHFEKSLSLEQVSFSYDGKVVFADLCLELEKAKKYVIVGESGVGKSTLLRLVRGELKPDSGSVRIDGVEVSELTRKSRASIFQTVGQEVFLFADTIRNNIFLYDSFPDAAYEAALRQVNLFDVVEGLERKGDTIVGTATSDLSGGQRQRVQIARGLIREKDIYLLDEVTANLDADNAALVEETIRGLDQTVLAIRHRVDESMRNYDAVIWLDQGQAKVLSVDAYLARRDA